MADEPKTIGAALVDVFDAGMTLIKVELRSIGTKIAQTVRLKGMGVVLILSTLIPIGIAVVFLLLGFYQMLVELAHIPTWGASLIMFAISLITAAILAVLGARRLGGPNE
ncbi:MAG: phage holin family protein [Deinococcaceae bacterium]